MSVRCFEGGLKNVANGYKKIFEVLNGQRQQAFGLVLCRVNIVTDPKFTFSARLFSCLSSYPYSDMSEGKGISWPVCRGESNAYVTWCWR